MREQDHRSRARRRSVLAVRPFESDPQQVDLGASRDLTIQDVVRVATSAWLLRSAARSELEVLKLRRELAEERLKTEDVERDLMLQRAIRSREQALLRGQLERERLQTEFALLRQKRLAPLAPPPPPVAAPPPGSPPPAAVEHDITEREMRALALRAVLRFSVMPDEQAERNWSAWRRELGLRFAPNVAAEIDRQAGELRELI